VDESTDPAVLTLPDVAGYARHHPHPVTAAHCVSLGSLPAQAAREVALQVAAAGMGVVTLPATNLYLQGRSGPGYGRRGLTAIDILRAAGVTVAAGADNVRDVFHPVGRCDPLEVAALLVTAGHQQTATAAAMVGEDARRILGQPPAGPRPGAAADLVALRVDGLDGAVADAPADRLVWRRGRLVSRTETVSEVAI
jgi:cytosine deaminase